MAWWAYVLIALVILGIVGGIGSAVNQSNPDWDATSVAVIILVVCGVIYGIYRFVSGGGGGGGGGGVGGNANQYQQIIFGSNESRFGQRGNAKYGYPRK